MASHPPHGLPGQRRRCPVCGMSRKHHSRCPYKGHSMEESRKRYEREKQQKAPVGDDSNPVISALLCDCGESFLNALLLPDGSFVCPTCSRIWPE